MKLNYKRTFFIGLAFFSITAFWQLYDNIIPLILDNTFGLGETATGVVMAIDNVLALFLLPLIGAYSDKVSTRFGKRMPFIVVGTISSVILMMLLPLADNIESFILFFFVLGAVLVTMSIYRSPAVALMPDLTPKELRSKANAVINLMGAVGGMFSLIVISRLVEDTYRPDYTYVFLSVAVVIFISMFILIFTINENKLAKEIKERDSALDQSSEEEEENLPMPADVKRSLYFLLASIFLWFTAYNAVTTAFSRYAVRVWGLSGGDFANTLLVATGAAVVSYIPIGFLSSKFGRKKIILLGITMMSLTYFGGIFYSSYNPSINVLFAFTGFGWAAINVNSYPMVVEMSKNRDIGKYTGYYYTFSMAAQIFTPIFSGLFLEWISYRSLFPYALIFSALSFITMLFVHHGDSKPSQHDNLLENFDVED